MLHAKSISGNDENLHSSSESYLHLLVMVDVQEALPELDNLKGHKQGDGDQIRIQNPECNHQNDPVHEPIFVVALQNIISKNTQQMSMQLQRCATNDADLPAAKPVASMSSFIRLNNLNSQHCVHSSQLEQQWSNLTVSLLVA